MIPSRLEYIWIDNDYQLRSKIKVMYLTKFNEIPNWNYDGSSTNQAVTNNSEITIKPRKIFKSKKDEYHLLVLCDTYDHNGIELQTNNRKEATDIFNKNLDEKPWFGMEQEYFLINPDTNKPLGFNEDKQQGQYYCSVGTENSFGRRIVEEHLLECINYGIEISGINAEVAPGQWEFQVGPCEGIEAGDHLWVARYLLYKITEKHNVIVNIDPKPLSGHWNGSGCHTNYSTRLMRDGSNKKNWIRLYI